MKLQWHPSSEYSLRVKLLAHVLGLDIELEDVSTSDVNRLHDYHMLDLFGQLPLLETDDDGLIGNSNAILVYLAKKFGGNGWYPEKAVDASLVQSWLSAIDRDFVAKAPRLTLAAINGRRVFDNNGAQAMTLADLDRHLVSRRWLATENVTIADVALYPAVIRLMRSTPDRWGYWAVLSWVDRMEALPNFPEQLSASLPINA